MKILGVSDWATEELAMCRRYVERHAPGADLIVSCGDMRPEYLEYLFTVTHGKVPVYYICGNHDPECLTESYAGCNYIDRRLVRVSGLRMMGLSGSMWYNGKPFQYREGEMRGRLRRMAWTLQRNRGLDIVIAHSPPAGLNDLEDIPHRGFQTYRGLIEQYRPRLFLHGHIHRSYARLKPVEQEYQGTRIVNVCGALLVEI